MRIIRIAILSLLALKVQAQNVENKWLINVGMHGPQFTIKNDFFWTQNWRLKDWNITPPISKLSASRYLTGGLSSELSFSIAKVAMQPKVDKSENLFMDIDLNVKYAFANGYILKTKSWFDPYLVAGVGTTYLDQDLGATKDKWFLAINYGAGLNIWFEKNVGLNIQAVYNMLPTVDNIQVNNITGDQHRDYMHHSAGLVFRFGKKDKDNDGIADNEDACPDMPGKAFLKGCPDKDADSVADRDDACVDVKGSVALKGCPDTDKDGVADKDDACVTERGKKELSGCPDSDGDGIADKDDACPNVAGMMNLKGCPDADGDGFTDSEDKCPNEYGKLNGCPDTDGDGILDTEDKCPKEAGIAELQGCPRPKIKEEEKVILEKKIATLAKSINFETGKEIIKKESYDELDQVVVFLKEYPDVNFKIEGHTDNVGEEQKNVELSKKRAAAVKAYLNAKGIVEEKLRSEGFGSSRPIADNGSAVGRAKNRRVDITVDNQ